MENYINLLQSIRFSFRKYGKYKAFDNNEFYTITCRGEQVYYILSGEAEIYLNNSVFKMFPHHIYYFPKGTVFRAKIVEEIDYYYICFDLPIEVKCLLDTVYIPDTVDCTKENKNFLKYISDFCDDTTPELSHFMKANACMQLVMSELIKDVEFSDEKTRRISAVLEYIEKNIREKISIKELAKSVNLCEAYFSTVFKESVGLSPKQYILKKKIDLAVDLLHDNRYTIGDVSKKVGFDDSLYFSRVFKEKTGMSPYQFKKIIEQKVMLP